MPASHVLEGWLSFSALGVAGESMVGANQATTFEHFDEILMPLSSSTEQGIAIEVPGDNGQLWNEHLLVKVQSLEKGPDVRFALRVRLRPYCQDVETDLVFDFHTEKMLWVGLSRLPQGTQPLLVVGVHQDTPAAAATRCTGPRHPPRKE